MKKKMKNDLFLKCLIAFFIIFFHSNYINIHKLFKTNYSNSYSEIKPSLLVSAISNQA